MGGMLSWIKSAAQQALDPRADQRVKEAAAKVEHELARRRKDFNLEHVVAALDIFPDDRKRVLKQTYLSLLNRAWRDLVITDSERQTLKWAGAALGLDAAEQNALKQRIGRETFAQVLSHILTHGQLNPADIERLHSIASELDLTAASLMRHYFGHESAGLLRGLFASIAADGQIDAEEWNALVTGVTALGLSKDDLINATAVQARELIEQTLAEAKDDESVSAKEEQAIAWLLENITNDQAYRNYVLAEVKHLKWIEAIEGGRLPSIQTQNISVRAGEIVHAESKVNFFRTRQLKNGLQTDTFHGVLTLTDNRLIFSSPTFGFEINHRRVLEFVPAHASFSMTAGKGSGRYAVTNEWFPRIYRVAIRLANQTVVRPPVEQTRIIPREVRQRVWQRFGGRCADCGANDYLEFDHVIPVAKGGNNSDNNVQLLCRRCNGKKSDHI